jgi:hypothetical protein
MADVFQNNWCRGVWVPAPVRNCALGRDDTVLALNPYCTLSATKRNSPSPFETSSSTDFLPSFLS